MSLVTLVAALAFAAATPQPVVAPVSSGSAYVSTLPTGCEVWVDGVYAGRSPVLVDLLTPGRHSVTISRAGWMPQLASFDVANGQTVTISVALSASSKFRPLGAPSERGSLAIRGQPIGAAAFVDGVSAGAIPTQPMKVAAGKHVVTIKPKVGPSSARLVTVYPDTTTVAVFSNVQMNAVAALTSADDVLAPLDTYVPSTSFTTSGNDVSIHFRGVEVQCTIGSRTYSLNGRAGTLTVPPALVQGRIYLPLSLLDRIANPKK